MASQKRRVRSRPQADGGDQRRALQPPSDMVARQAYHERPQTKPAPRDSQVDEASEESFPASDPPASTHCTST
jgi:hypothetical protein